MPPFNHFLLKQLFNYLTRIKVKPHECRFIHLSLRYSKKDNNGLESRLESNGSNLKTKITQHMLLNELSTRNKLSFEEWDKIQDEVLKAGRSITKKNIDANIIGACFQKKQLDLAKSYLSYLKHRNEELNFATIGKLLRLYYIAQNENDIDKNTQEDIFSLYDNLLTKSKILDSTTAENAIHALSLTNRWKECLGLLEMIKITNSPNASAYSAISAAAFANQDDQLGWKLLYEMRDLNRIPLEIAYLPLLKYAELNKTQFKENLLSLFKYFSLNDIRPSKSFIDELTIKMEKIGFHCQLTEISKIGECKICNETLRAMKLSDEEYRLLKNNFYTKVILGNDVYRKSNPKELENYLEFIAKNQSFDMVVDGLNTAYSAGVQSSHVYVNMISAVVKHFIDKGKSVMVFGRAHMSKWPKQQLNYISKNSVLFLTENISQDDPFLLYAAMNSGPNTGFLSRDLMRSHAFKMGDQYIRSLFHRWQHHNQHQLIYVDNKKGIVNIKNPISYMPITQQNGLNWHIPFDENIKDTRILFEVPKKWICVSM